MLQQLIDKYLASDRGTLLDLNIPIHQDKPVENRKFRASDAGRCRLYRYWKRQGKDGAKPDAIGLRNMELGNIIHAWLNMVMDQADVLECAELEMHDDHRIGHLDAIVSHHGQRVLYDYKTIGGKKAFYIEKHGVAADRLHQMQVITYADMCEIPIDELRIAYINRENLKIWEVTVDPGRTNFYREEVEKDWEALRIAWNNQVIPRANPERWECHYCLYHDECTQRLSERNS